MTIDEIIEKAIPFAPSDCKRIRAKKEWLRQETKTRLEEYMQSVIAGVKLSMIQYNPIPPHPSGGVVFGPQIALVGDDPGRKEYFIPEKVIQTVANPVVFITENDSDIIRVNIASIKINDNQADK